jgi:hypothetical protein
MGGKHRMYTVEQLFRLVRAVDATVRDCLDSRRR